MHFPAGEHHITTPITVNGGEVTGEGIGVTILIIDTPNGYGIICDMKIRPRMKPCSLEDLTITSTITRTGGAAVMFQGAPPGISHLVRNISIEKQMVGIHFSDAVAFTFRDSIISFPRPGGIGVIVEQRSEPDAGDSVIDNILFNDNNNVAQAAIYHVDSGGLNIVNSKVLGFDYASILNIARGRNTGQLDIAYNSFENQRLSSISVYGEGGYFLIDISHNQLTVKNYGIIFQSHHRSIIQSNRIFCWPTPAVAGIAITGTSSEVKVLDNGIYNCANDIVVHPTTTQIQIRR